MKYSVFQFDDLLMQASLTFFSTYFVFAANDRKLFNNDFILIPALAFIATDVASQYVHLKYKWHLPVSYTIYRVYTNINRTRIERKDRIKKGFKYWEAVISVLIRVKLVTLLDFFMDISHAAKRKP